MRPKLARADGGAQWAAAASGTRVGHRRNGSAAQRAFAARGDDCNGRRASSAARCACVDGGASATQQVQAGSSGSSTRRSDSRSVSPGSLLPPCWQSPPGSLLLWSCTLQSRWRLPLLRPRWRLPLRPRWRLPLWPRWRLPLRPRWRLLLLRPRWQAGWLLLAPPGERLLDKGRLFQFLQAWLLPCLAHVLHTVAGSVFIRPPCTASGTTSTWQSRQGAARMQTCVVRMSGIYSRLVLIKSLRCKAGGCTHARTGRGTPSCWSQAYTHLQ